MQFGLLFSLKRGLIWFSAFAILSARWKQHAKVAQLVEQCTENAWVPSSSLGLGNTKPALVAGFCFPLVQRLSTISTILSLTVYDHITDENILMTAHRFATIAALLTVTVLLGLSSRSVQAQTGGAACPALVELALSQVGNNCANLPRNSACYGYNKVESTFSQSVPEAFFQHPADLSPLNVLSTLQTAPLDLGLGQWGVAVMNAQANVPDTLPGQAVTFLLMGETTVENAVEPEAAASAGQQITVIAQVNTVAYTAPDTTSTINSAVNAGTVLNADGTSADKVFLRLPVSGSSPLWVERAALNPNPLMDSLPVVGNSPSLQPMQSFYFRTGPGQTTCTQTPSVLAIRSPENIQVDITANGAKIRLGSLITLKVLPPGNRMKLAVLEGGVTLDPDGANPLYIPAGFSTTRCLTEAQSLGIDGLSNDQEVGKDCSWSPPEPNDLNDLDEGQIVLSTFERLGFGTPPPTPTATSPAPPADECPFGTTITHTVSGGENLYRISLRYRTSLGAIMTASNISNPELVYVGQVLTIPCGVDTGMPSVPPTPVTNDQPPTTAGVDCGSFRATSPLDGLSFGQNTFFWDAAPGATGYVVKVYNEDEKSGGQVASFAAGAGQTNLTANLTVETIGFGFAFSWEVQALYNGQVACTSQRYRVPRGSPPVSQCPVSTTC